MPKEILKKIPPDIPDRNPWDILQQIPKGVSWEIYERIPERIPRSISEAVPRDRNAWRNPRRSPWKHSRATLSRILGGFLRWILSGIPGGISGENLSQIPTGFSGGSTRWSLVGSLWQIYESISEEIPGEMPERILKGPLKKSRKNSWSNP